MGGIPPKNPVEPPEVPAKLSTNKVDFLCLWWKTGLATKFFDHFSITAPALQFWKVFVKNRHQFHHFHPFLRCTSKAHQLLQERSVSIHVDSKCKKKTRLKWNLMMLILHASESFKFFLINVVVNFLSQVIFIFLLFQLHKHTLPYPKTKE